MRDIKLTCFDCGKPIRKINRSKVVMFAQRDTAMVVCRNCFKTNWEPWGVKGGDPSKSHGDPS